MGFAYNSNSSNSCCNIFGSTQAASHISVRVQVSLVCLVTFWLLITNYSSKDLLNRWHLTECIRRQCFYFTQTFCSVVKSKTFHTFCPNLALPNLVDNDSFMYFYVTDKRFGKLSHYVGQVSQKEFSQSVNETILSGRGTSWRFHDLANELAGAFAFLGIVCSNALA